MFWIVSILLILLIFYKSKLCKYNENYLAPQYTNCMKGICALLVVMNHSFEECRLWGILAVSMFFFYSGYGLMKSYNANDKYFNGFWQKRVNKVLIPFWITNIIYIILLSIKRRTTYSWNQILLSFFDASIMTTGWYMISILIIYFTFYISFKVFKKMKTKNKIILNFILICFYIVIARAIGCKSWWYTSVITFIIGLIWGYKKEYIDKILKLNYNKIMVFITIIFVILYIIPYVLKRFDGMLFVGINFLLTIIFVFLINLISMKIKIENKILKEIGNISLEIYLIHPLIFKILEVPSYLYFVKLIITYIAAKLYSILLKKIYGKNEKI